MGEAHGKIMSLLSVIIPNEIDNNGQEQGFVWNATSISIVASVSTFIAALIAFVAVKVYRKRSQKSSVSDGPAYGTLPVSPLN
jgi:hypothetical protein